MEIKKLLFFFIVVLSVVYVNGFNNVQFTNNNICHENCNEYGVKNMVNRKLDLHKLESMNRNNVYSTLYNSYGAFRWFKNILKNKSTKHKNSKINHFIKSAKVLNINLGLKELNNKYEIKAMSIKKNIIIGILLIIIYHLNPQ
ncbi:hypothetical protein BCR36DRAFT_409505 [Piromyces finnis]|uniref:Uncharacterized protein n=1 Tax=Piromyces finnis TaxID=1754191 RepID=A0A1Y1VIF3_9FUNG|nr:hypothetical protein BCR36DRAFT_409505 [Piromyces finnis]|eukprot:ORX57184.1 hypothetical protein BCR36DRAFT_409505 [Piromyces finnis]